MRDEIYDRDYQAGRAELHAGIDRLAASVGTTFRALTAIQFAAPWRDSKPRPASRGSARHVLLILVGVALASGATVATALAPFAIA